MRAIRSRQLFDSSALLVQPGETTFGSLRPSQFLSDLAAGRDSLDIVIVGDSNTGSAISDMWGYHHGFQQALFTRGYTMYGTPVCPVVTGFTTGAAAATPNIWRGTNTMATGGVAAQSPLLDGNVSGSGTVYAAWSPSVTLTRYGSSTSVPPYKESWGYLANSTQYFSTDGLALNSDHPLVVANTTVRYRVRYGKIVGSAGAFCPIVLDGSTPAKDMSVRQAFPSLSLTGGIDSAAAEVSWSPTSTPNAVPPFRGGWAYVSSPSVTNGPTAIHSHSMYRVVKGFAVTSHAYQGGETSTQIAAKIDAVKGTVLQEHLKELRQRQIAAGGSGRVLVMAQSGINGADTATTWVAAHQTIWAAYRSAWATLGYPTSDLAIVSWVGHVLNATDTSDTGATGNMAECRTAAQQMAANSPDHCVVDVKKLLTYEQLLWAGGNGTTLYQRYNNIPAAGANIVAHLSGGWYTGTTYGPSDGYSTMSNLIVSALLSAG